MKQGQDAWDEFSVIRVFRKARRKAHLELNFCEDVEDNKKDFFKYINNKRSTKGNVGPLLTGTVTVATEAAEKAEVLNAFFDFSVHCQGQASGISNL